MKANPRETIAGAIFGWQRTNNCALASYARGDASNFPIVAFGSEADALGCFQASPMDEFLSLLIAQYPTRPLEIGARFLSMPRVG